jgi:putative ABC transport system permease protein
LVATEIALALAVLSSATLLVKSLLRLQSVDPGYDVESVLSFRLVLPEATYPDSATGLTSALLAQLDAGLRALPGVSSVAFATSLPPDELQIRNDYTVEGATSGARGDSGVAAWIQADPEYFRTMRIATLRGRVFGPEDREGSPQVAVVNEAFARRHFGGADPVGRRIQGGSWSPAAPWSTIVGVVRDVSYSGGPADEPEPTVYLPYAQHLYLRSPFVLIRSSADAASLAPAVRRLVSDLDPAVPLRDVATMEDRVRGSTAAPRLRTTFLSLLAGVALVLAVTGIYGVVAYDVTQHRRETAVKRALGASWRDISRAALGSGLRFTAAGIVMGSVGALLLMRAFGGLLYEVVPLDLGVLAAAIAVTAVTAFIACSVPATLATRVDPMSVLRDE